MCGAVTPLLELISKLTGFRCITLLAGTPPSGPKEPYMIGSVHYGKTNEATGRNFGEFDRAKFRHNVLGEFHRFLKATKGKSVILRYTGSKYY